MKIEQMEEDPTPFQRILLFLIITLLIVLALIGCSSEPPPPTELELKTIVHQEINYSFRHTVELLKIDSCEYLLAVQAQGISIIHKYNCKNHSTVIKK